MTNTSSRQPRMSSQKFMRDMLKIISNPQHPLHFLVEPKKDQLGKVKRNLQGNIVFDWRTTERITRSGRKQRGRYQGGNRGQIVQAGHLAAYATGQRQIFVLEDADINQVTGQTIESKGALSYKTGTVVEGVPVELSSAQQWVRDGDLPQKYIAETSRIYPPGYQRTMSSKDNRGTESSRPKEKNRKTEDRNVQKQRSKRLGDVKPKTDVTASAESTPASKSKTPSQAKSQRLSKLSNFKNIRLNPKLKIGLKIGAGLLLDIGLSILESWIDNRHIQKLFNKIAPNISLEANRAFQQAENEILKFRTGNELEKGYQLYFKINLKFSRTCSDGGCGFSGSMNNIQLVSIEVARNQSKNRIPDPKESNFGDLSKVNGFIFESIFENGKYITLGVNHAADGNFTLIYSLIGKKREGYLREQDAIYIRQFDEYVRAFPESFSAVTWQRLSMFINFKKLLTGAGLYSPWDLWIEDKIPFETIIEEVQWEDGFLIRDTFIKDFYDFLPKWAKTNTKYYLKKYEKYFALLKNRDRVCNVSCHSTNDRGLNYRGILTDFRRDMLNEMEVPKFIQKSN